MTIGEHISYEASEDIEDRRASLFGWIEKLAKKTGQILNDLIRKVSDAVSSADLDRAEQEIHYVEEQAEGRVGW